MDDEIAIKVEGVSKKFSRNLKRSMLYGVSDIARNSLGMGSKPERLRKGEFWAVSRDQESSLGHWEDDLLCGPEFNFVDSIKDDGFVRAIRP